MNDVFFIKALKFLKWTFRQRKNLFDTGNYRALTIAPPGHFYSPLPDRGEIEANAGEIFDRSVRELPAIDLNENGQIDLLRSFAGFYEEMPFRKSALVGRYNGDNIYFHSGDLAVLYSFMRRFRPKRIVEVGSGHSSAAMLEVNDLFFDGAIAFTFVEPFPERLYRMLTRRDRERCRVEETPVQQTPDQLYSGLEENDILFVDSSRVGKIHSDLLRILFKILPSLKPGVIIHFHDIFWPFEYPKTWTDIGRAWNEAYFLRAFLQYNPSFEILYFSSFMETHHRDLLEKHLPLAVTKPASDDDPMNAGFWIRKVRL